MINPDVIAEARRWAATFTDRKIDDGDLEDNPDRGWLTAAAQLYAASYDGTFEFLEAMRTTMHTKGELTIGQARGVLNCLRAEALRELHKEKARQD